MTRALETATADRLPSIHQPGVSIFRVPLRYETPWGVSLAVVLALMGISAIILERRVRGVEVVA